MYFIGYQTFQWLTSVSTRYTFPVTFTTPFTGITYTTSRDSKNAWDARIEVLNYTTIGVLMYGFRAIVVGI